MVSPSGRFVGHGITWDLWPGRSYRFGRQPDSEIRLPYHPMVSRYHAIVEPTTDETAWQVRDLASANGTFINDQRLDTIHHLRSGDTLKLGRTGPCFVFEALPATNSGQSSRSPWPKTVLASSAPPSEVTLTQLFPLLSTGHQLGDNPIFVLGLITITIGISLFVGFGNPIVFNGLLALYLSLFLYYLFIYQLCGKAKSWLLLVGMAIATIGLLKSPVLTGFLWFFRQVLPGEVITFSPSTPEGPHLLQVISHTFIGTGLMEEILKALPVLFWVALSQRLPRPWRKSWGVEDPLDGILLCTASALGFTLLETLGQYVPQVTHQITGTTSLEAGQLAGLQLLIPRVLGSIAGHLAYSGYFGYFIGLICLRSYAVLQQLGLLALGCLSAALLHTLWNVAGLLSPILLALSGILSYSLLMAAILKARTFE
ncbi:MAG: PrsW family glutamic-type intramembrane protease [Prochlorotrichaceae cyanobacterium]